MSKDFDRTDRRPAGREPRIADADTLERARRADTDAMADLWTIYHPQLLGLLRSRGAASAEDIASQVWLDVGRSIERFEGDGVAFRRWLFTIAGRRSIDDRRRAWRRREVSVESMGYVAGVSEPDERLSWSLEAAQAMLNSLNPATRQVIMLRIVHDMSVPRVAEATGRSEGSVRVLVHRGLNQLRERAASTPRVVPGASSTGDEVEVERSEPGCEPTAEFVEDLETLLIAAHS